MLLTSGISNKDLNNADDCDEDPSRACRQIAGGHHHQHGMLLYIHSIMTKVSREYSIITDDASLLKQQYLIIR